LEDDVVTEELINSLAASVAKTFIHSAHEMGFTPDEMVLSLEMMLSITLMTTGLMEGKKDVVLHFEETLSIMSTRGVERLKILGPIEL
jgi:hypothetical protein